jgi:lipid-A-disaccharide synthase
VLVNLILGENVIPERLQRNCTPDKLAETLLPLFGDSPERRRQLEAFARLDDLMSIGDEAPSMRAARIVLDVATRRTIPLAPQDGAGAALTPAGRW